MSTKMRFFGIMLIALAVVGCTKPKDDNNDELVSTNSVKVATSTPTDITSNSASCGGAAFVDGVITLTELGVCWDTTSNPTPANNKLSTEDYDQPYLCTISDLTPGTSYHVRAFAYDGRKYYYGEDKSFTTESAGSGGNGNVTITVSTNNVTEITSTSATCGGEVSVNGDVTVIARGVCWSTTPNPTIDQTHTSDGQGDGTFTSKIIGLAECTTYYVRAYAQTSSAVEYGDEKSFSTTTAFHSEVQVKEVTHNSIKIKVSPAPDVTYYYSKLLGIGNPERHEASETELIFSNLSAETEYSLGFTFYDNGDNLLDNKTVSATTNEQPYEPAHVTVTLINVTPTYMELKFEPSSNAAYYCYNVGGTLTSTTHQTGVQTKKFSSLQGEYFQPDTEYEFSVVAYDANGTAGEIIHPKFKTTPAPYSNYYRVFDNFYQLDYARLVNEPTANTYIRSKEIQIWSAPGYWVRFYTLCNWYETDNNWTSGVYTTGGNMNSVGFCACEVYKKGSLVGVSGGSTFTITKNGNMSTYDLYGERGSITAHFTGVPTY